MIGASYVFVAGYGYQYKKTKQMTMIMCGSASFVMGVVAGFVNYFILLPLFEMFLPLDQLIASFSEFMPWIQTKFDVVLYNVIPFTIIKGLVISLITVLIYHRLQPILERRYS